MSGPFNKKNFFGKHCVAALIPGWGTEGSVRSVGQEFVFDLVEHSGGATEHEIVNHSYGVGVGDATALYSKLVSGTQYSTMSRVNATDTGIQFPNSGSLTVVTICRPVGDGRNGTGSDSRIWSQDTGFLEADHDLMLGWINSNANARARVRIGSGVVKTVITTISMQQDALNLIAGGVTYGGTNNYDAWCAHLREDGGYDDNTGSTAESVGYNPRSSTTMGLFGTQQDDNGNGFDGDIIGVWFFDTSFYGSSNVPGLLGEFFKNPWQVFAPRRILIPLIDAPIVSIEEGPGTTVIITDVNGTETWIDGATGLIITGTGFRGA